MSLLQAYSSKRSLFPHPLAPRDPRGHCGPNDVLLNPSATFTFEQMVDVSHFVMCAINAMTYPPQVHFTSEQAQVAALHWFEVVSGHLHSAMAQKMDYTSPEGTQWYYDLEQAENRAEILLSTIDVYVYGGDKVVGPKDNTWDGWSVFSRVYKCLHKAMKQVIFPFTCPHPPCACGLIAACSLLQVEARLIVAKEVDRLRKRARWNKPYLSWPGWSGDILNPGAPCSPTRPVRHPFITGPSLGRSCVRRLVDYLFAT